MSDERGLGRVLVVDAQPVVRAGLEAILAADETIAVCGHAASPREAFACIADLSPDLVVTEVSFPGGVRLDFLKDLRARHPDTPVIVFSNMPEAVYAGRALRSGARGWVSKAEEGTTLLAAVQQVLAGETWPISALRSRRKPVGAATETTLSPVDTLSDRELQVYELIGQGLGTTQIARTLHLSVKTIESHKEKLKRKLSLPSSSELQIMAVEWQKSSAKDPPRPVGEDPHTRPPYLPNERRISYTLSSLGGEPIPLDPVEPLTIGRGASAQVRLNSTLVSREQARLYWDAARGFVLQDLGSRNGTFINGHPIVNECLLRDGDTLQIANVVLSFCADRPAERGIEEEVTRTWTLL